MGGHAILGVKLVLITKKQGERGVIKLKRRVMYNDCTVTQITNKHKMNTHAIEAELDALTASNAMEVANAKYVAAKAEYEAAAAASTVATAKAKAAEAMTPKAIAKKAYDKAKKHFDEKKTELDTAEEKKKKDKKIADAVRVLLINNPTEAELAKIEEATEFLKENAVKAARKLVDSSKVYEVESHRFYCHATRDFAASEKRYERYTAKHESVKANSELAVKLVNLSSLDANDLRVLVEAMTKASRDAFTKAYAKATAAEVAAKAALEAFTEATAAYEADKAAFA